MKRFGMVVHVAPEKLEYYKELHRNVWEGVLKTIYDCNMRNYSIYLKDDFLFSYFEYIGEDFEADMEKMGEDPISQEWWKETSPCQIPFDGEPEGTIWSTMEEVFHVD